MEQHPTLLCFYSILIPGLHSFCVNWGPPSRNVASLPLKQIQVRTVILCDSKVDKEIRRVDLLHVMSVCNPLLNHCN